jgi:hypothetical protein
MTTLLIRKDTKQGFAAAASVTMLDTLDSLKAWVEALNADAGWAKYGVGQ